MRYKAFISYRRQSDEAVAAALQQRLQRFLRPWYRPISLRIYRDKTSGTVGDSLTAMLRAALDDSEFLILIASRASASSPWVSDEVRYWCEAGRAARLLLVRTDGSLAWDPATRDFRWDGDTAVPRALSGVFSQEPAYLDLGWARTDHANEARKNTANALWHDAVATLAVRLLGQTKEELIGLELRQRRWLQAVMTAVIIVLVGLTTAASVFAYRAEARRRIATSRQVAVQALRAPRVDQGLLLSLAAMAISDTPEARGALLTRLQASRRLQRVVSHDIEMMRVRPLGPDLFAAAADKGDIFIHRIATGEVVATLPSSGADVRSMAAASPERLVVVLGDGRLFCWNPLRRTSTTNPLWPTKFTSVALRPGTDVAVIGDAEGNVHILDVPSCELRARWHLTGDEVAVVDEIGPGTCVLGSETGHVVGFDCESGSPRFSRKAGSARVEVIGSKDGVLFVLDGSGQLVQWRSGSVERTQLVGDVIAAAYDPSRDEFAVSDSEGMIRLFSRDTRALLQSLPGHGLFAGDLAFARGGRLLLSSSFDKSVMIWDLDRDHPVVDQAYDFASRPSATFTSSGSVAAVAASGSRVQNWLLAGGTRTVVGTWAADAPEALTVSNDGSKVAWTTASAVWLGEAGSPARPIGAQASPALKLAFSADAQWLAGTDQANRLSVWNLRGSPAWRTAPGSSFLTAIAFAPNGCCVAVGDDTGSLRLYKQPTGELLSNHSNQHQGLLFSLAFDPESNVLASGGGGGDRNILVRELDSSRVQTLRDVHRGPIGALAFDPAGGLFASAANDGTVTLWDRPSLQPLGVGLTSHTSFPSRLRFRADGKRLLSTDDDRILVWITDVQQWARIACAMAGREISIAEWQERIPDDTFRTVCAAGSSN